MTLDQQYNLPYEHTDDVSAVLLFWDRSRPSLYCMETLLPDRFESPYLFRAMGWSGQSYAQRDYGSYARRRAMRTL
jgi:hypothetical protein